MEPEQATIYSECDQNRSYIPQEHISVHTFLSDDISPAGITVIEKINATPTQPQRTVLKYFAIFKIVAQSLEPGETPSYSASHQAPNYEQHS